MVAIPNRQIEPVRAVIPDAVVDAIAPALIETMRAAAIRIPVTPAAQLGGTRAKDAEPDFETRSEWDRLGHLLPERLLGALELWLTEVNAPLLEPLSELLPQKTDTGVMNVTLMGACEPKTALDKLEALRPGTSALISDLATRVSEHPAIVPLLRVTVTDGDETEIPAAHGRAYFALCVAVAATVLRALDRGHETAAVLGSALLAADGLLRAAPLPQGYEHARVARIREGYLYPRASRGAVAAQDHRFALTEAEFPETADFGENGLVTLVPGGIAVRTGTADGIVSLRIDILEEPPTEVDTTSWDEVVEVAWTAHRGLASIVGAPANPGLRPSYRLVEQTPPWPGTYRVRVHAVNRDDPRSEHYQLTVWRSENTEPVVHRRTDRLGYRLRGEPEPPAVAKPEDAYRWIAKSTLGDAATITLVAGADPDTVLEALGADPTAPGRMDTLGQPTSDYTTDPWVAVARVAGGCWPSSTTAIRLPDARSCGHSPAAPARHRCSGTSTAGRNCPSPRTAKSSPRPNSMQPRRIPCSNRSCGTWISPTTATESRKGLSP
ncbi:hypothetical protein [Nocardia sp. NPDC050435]|uniref:hypothetical protein n=1 Tax=Nocardia sp. NPDC050435 TaxID=3155040 RepID=UPI0033C7D04C